MLTPARRHFLKTTAAALSAAAKPNTPQTGDQYELMYAALYEARKTLKAIKSLEAKATKKRDLLPQFEPYILGVLQSGNGAQDDVLLSCMVWFFDIGELEKGLNIAAYGIQHNLQTPDRYKRDIPALIAEDVAEQALKELAAATDENRVSTAVALLPHLTRAQELTEQADIHDQIRAKLYKATGYAYRDKQGHIEDAIQCLKRALELNDKVGVKKDIEQLERQLKQAEKQAAEQKAAEQKAAQQKQGEKAQQESQTP